MYFVYFIYNKKYFLQYLKKNKINLDENIEDFDYNNIDNENFEPIAKGVLTPGIQIRNLKKTYKNTCFQKSVSFFSLLNLINELLLL